MASCSRTPEGIDFLVRHLTREQVDSFVKYAWCVNARDDQLPPLRQRAGEPWRTWLVLGGRGSGKTRTGAEWVRAQALGDRRWPTAAAQRIALVGETIGQVRSVMIEGVSGLLAIHPPLKRPKFEVSKNQLVWPNGTIAQMFAADDPDSLRGPQFDAAWCDELCQVAPARPRLGHAAVRAAARALAADASSPPRRAPSRC